MQLVLTDKIPDNQRQKAEFTLQRLGLNYAERILRQREEWFRMYKQGEITLAGLARKAPLIARAIEKQQTIY
ncbi:MAG: hypothetical protein VKK07_14290 [Merismopediaceae bacterium]|nr:hypothetical protein [Merismopediaceae bacterium]